MENQSNPTILDPFTATVKRWSWDSDETVADRIEAERAEARDERARLYRLLDLLRDRDLPTPSISPAWTDGTSWVARWYVDEADAARAVRRAIGTPSGGVWEKKSASGHLTLEMVTDGLRLVVDVAGATCERVVVGTETVETSVDVCPVCESDLVKLETGGTACSDDGCSYDTVPPKKVRRPVEREVVEWNCPDLNGENGEVTA